MLNLLTQIRLHFCNDFIQVGKTYTVLSVSAVLGDGLWVFFLPVFS